MFENLGGSGDGDAQILEYFRHAFDIDAVGDFQRGPATSSRTHRQSCSTRSRSQ
jgi:hypothetical protein